MEAMAARVPVVATDVVGTRAVVRHERTGLLARWEDDAGIAAALARVLGDAGVRARLTEAAHGAIRADWHEDRVVERVDRVYRGLLGGGSP
jgi:glycosyltransferase involved in cell wall biosynthesis